MSTRISRVRLRIWVKTNGMLGKHISQIAPHRLHAICCFRPLSTRMQRFFFPPPKDQSFPLPTDCFRNTFFSRAVATCMSVDGRHYYSRGTPRQLTSVVSLFLEQSSCYVYVLLNLNYCRLLWITVDYCRLLSTVDYLPTYFLAFPPSESLVLLNHRYPFSPIACPLSPSLNLPLPQILLHIFQPPQPSSSPSNFLQFTLKYFF